MRNIALFLTYEGTAYHGWQSQKNLATVQQTLEKAGITATVRRSLGGDIDASCGQLRRKYTKESN